MTLGSSKNLEAVYRRTLVMQECFSSLTSEILLFLCIFLLLGTILPAQSRI